MMSNSLLLIRIVETILEKRINGVHLRPVSRSNCIFNIRKCLDLLKKQRKISRKWLWRCDKIYERDFMSCLGLLEDLHRFADGMPRRNEKCYYKDGPYIVFNP